MHLSSVLGVINPGRFIKEKYFNHCSPNEWKEVELSEFDSLL